MANFREFFEKKTQYLMNTLYVQYMPVHSKQLCENHCQERYEQRTLTTDMQEHPCKELHEHGTFKLYQECHEIC